MNKLFRNSLLLLLISLILSSCYVGRFVWWNFADIRDYKKFKHANITKPDVPFTFKKGISSSILDTITYKGVHYKFDDFIEKDKSVAFLIIRNDSILYEKYFNKYADDSYVPTFSAAKSIVSALVGIAIAEGKIKSVDEPITTYLPELKKRDERFSKITIEDLLNMRSGILFKESYFNPFGDVAKSYYGRNLLAQMKKLKIKEDPDKEFEYISFNTQLLGFIVERATGKKLYEYLQEKIWTPLGMEFDATWSIDCHRQDEVKAFCCLNARARDFAKIGRLYLNEGNWNGKQIVPKDWVNKSTIADENTKDLYYTYQWWHNVNFTKLSDTSQLKKTDIAHVVTYTDNNGKTSRYLGKPCNDFFANGFLGQYIYVYPEKKIIIVRLGKHEKVGWSRIFRKIAQEL